MLTFLKHFLKVILVLNGQVDTLGILLHSYFKLLINLVSLFVLTIIGLKFSDQ